MFATMAEQMTRETPIPGRVLVVVPLVATQVRSHALSRREITWEGRKNTQSQGRSLRAGDWVVDPSLEMGES